MRAIHQGFPFFLFFMGWLSTFIINSDLQSSEFSLKYDIWVDSPPLANLTNHLIPFVPSILWCHAHNALYFYHSRPSDKVVLGNFLSLSLSWPHLLRICSFEIFYVPLCSSFGSVFFPSVFNLHFCTFWNFQKINAYVNASRQLHCYVHHCIPCAPIKFLKV